MTLQCSTIPRFARKKAIWSVYLLASNEVAAYLTSSHVAKKLFFSMSSSTEEELLSEEELARLRLLEELDEVGVREVDSILCLRSRTSSIMSRTIKSTSFVLLQRPMMTWLRNETFSRISSVSDCKNKQKVFGRLFCNDSNCNFIYQVCRRQEAANGSFGLRIKLPPAQQSTTYGRGFILSLCKTYVKQGS